MSAVSFETISMAPPQFEPRPSWLRPVAFVLIGALHAVALVGFAAYRPAPPPALETLDLSLVAQGDEAPENTKDVQPEAAAPKDPVIPPDLTPPPPVVEDKPPEPETPPPPPDQMIVDPLPPPPTPDPPPPPDQMAFDALPAPDDAPPPTIREAADAIDMPLPPPPPPAPVATPTPVPTPRPVVAQAPPPPKPKPRPKPRATTPPGEDKENQQSSQRHRVGIAEGQSQDAGMSRETYGAMLMKQAMQHQFYPESARERGVTGAGVVGFTVAAAGGIASVWMVQSTGSAELDAASRQIVRSIAAPPPPGGAFSASIPVHYGLR